MQRDLGAQNRSVLKVREDSNTKSTQQPASEVEVQKSLLQKRWFMIVCLCANVSDKEIKALYKKGFQTPEAIGEQCEAGTGCKSCVEQISCILMEEKRLAKLRPYANADASIGEQKSCLNLHHQKLLLDY